MDAALKIAILKKMVTQLEGVIGDMRASTGSVSIDTRNKHIAEAEAQLEALKWAAEECEYWNE